MKTGFPPTARKARTGLLTPPGMTRHARSKSDPLGCDIRILLDVQLRRRAARMAPVARASTATATTSTHTRERAGTPAGPLIGADAIETSPAGGRGIDRGGSGGSGVPTRGGKGVAASASLAVRGEI